LRGSIGLSFGEIAKALNIAPATARRWTLDIPLSAEQVEAISQRARAALQRGSAEWCSEQRRRREQWQQEGRARARLGEPLHLAGCLLYWAEGAKNRNSVKFANSDVNMLRLFRRFLSQCFGLDSAQLTFRVHVYLNNGLSIAEIENFWLEALDLDRRCLRRHQINKRPAPTSGMKRNKLPYGVGNLDVLKSTWLAQHIFGAIQEYGEFEEPRWLDLQARA
jgi:hypothetical protein